MRRFHDDADDKLLLQTVTVKNEQELLGTTDSMSRRIIILLLCLDNAVDYGETIMSLILVCYL